MQLFVGFFFVSVLLAKDKKKNITLLLLFVVVKTLISCSEYKFAEKNTKNCSGKSERYIEHGNLLFSYDRSIGFTDRGLGCCGSNSHSLFLKKKQLWIWLVIISIKMLSYLTFRLTFSFLNLVFSSRNCLSSFARDSDCLEVSRFEVCYNVKYANTV